MEDNMLDHKQHSEIMLGLGKLEGLYTGIISRMDIANGRTSKNEIKIEVLEKGFERFENRISNLEKHGGSEEKAAERRKDWMWGAGEKVIFALIGAVLILAGLVLSKLGIVNLG